jgi:shikimate kinase
MVSRNIILTGFMGCGKTTVGRLLARRLGRKFADLDREIEMREHRRIPAIFRESGEGAFREMEFRAIRGLVRRKDLVVAVGGGAPVFPRNHRWLKRAGMTVYLRVPARVLTVRLLAGRNRPLLAPARRDPGTVGVMVKGLLGIREKHYRRADLTVDLGSAGPARATALILRALLSTAILKPK